MLLKSETSASVRENPGIPESNTLMVWVGTPIEKGQDRKLTQLTQPPQEQVLRGEESLTLGGSRVLLQVKASGVLMWALNVQDVPFPRLLSFLIFRQDVDSQGLASRCTRPCCC